jgi:hypothetical protein
LKKKPARLRAVLAFSLMPLLWLCTSQSASAAASCDASLTAAIPPRPAGAPNGSQFVRQLQGLDDDAREAAILDEIMAGNIPQFLRRLSPVSLDANDPGPDKAVVCVTPDYLAIGTDDDYFLVPMRLETALAIARRFGFVLPTPKIVDAVYAQSQVQLQPQPLPASDAMRTTWYYSRHNRMVHEQRAATGLPLGALTAGDKKDLVLTNRLWIMRDRVAIYGWHLPGGQPIQPLSTVHGWRYADYSHGVRLVADRAYIGATARPMLQLLSESRSAGWLNDEGPIPRLSTLLGTLSRRDFYAGMW